MSVEHRREDAIVETAWRNEDIANKRLSLMLVFVGLVFVGSTRIVDIESRVLILAWGAVICLVLTLAVWRAQRRHNRLRKKLEKYEQNPTVLVTKELEKDTYPPWTRDYWRLNQFYKIWNVGSMKNLVGYVLPAFVTLSISFCTLATHMEWRPFGKTSEPKCPCRCTIDVNDEERFFDDESGGAIQEKQGTTGGGY